MKARQRTIYTLVFFAVVLPLVVVAQTSLQTAQVDRNPEVSFSATPTVSGSASTTAAFLDVSVFKIGSGTVSDKKVYENETTPLHNGRWAITVSPAIGNGKYRVEIRSGNSLLATSSLTVGLESLPTIALDTVSLPVYDVADGRLMRFSMTASPSGPVTIGQLSFGVSAVAASVSQLTLNEYSDPGYAQAVGSSTESVATSSPIVGMTLFQIAPPFPLEIPAGQTDYFEVDGAVAPTDTTYTVTTTLLGDSVATTTNTAANLSAQGVNLIWSPNTYDIASTSESDWTSGWNVLGLPQDGLSETRTSAPEILPPTCTITPSSATATAGETVTVTWSSTYATYALWSGGGASVPPTGTGSFIASSTRAFTLLFYGPYGMTPCSATVVVLPSVSTGSASSPASSTSATSSSATSTDKFLATPTSGSSPLSVVFKGTANTALSCSASYDLLSYGDGGISQIVVGSKVCKTQSFSFSHSYGKAGSYMAALYQSKTSSMSTTSAKLQQSQLIVVTSSTSTNGKMTTTAGSTNNTASVSSALTAAGAFFQRLFHFLGL
jgi:hypothetical protein